MPSIMVNRIKVNPKTQELNDAKPFASRLTIDGPRQKIMHAKRGTPTPPRPAHAENVDRTTVHFLYSMAAEDDHDLYSIDVANAYCKGTRINRGPAYVSLECMADASERYETPPSGFNSPSGLARASSLRRARSMSLSMRGVEFFR